MSSPLEQEPPGGDYVRYIERLVERSAMQLQKHQAGLGGEPAVVQSSPVAAVPVRAPAAPRTPRPATPRPKKPPQGVAGVVAQRFPQLWRWRWLLAAVLVALCVVLPELLAWLVFVAVLAWQQARGKKK